MGKLILNNKSYTGSQDLSGLTDVAISSPQNDEVLAYNSTTHKWENKTGGGGGSGGHTILDDSGTSLAQQPNLQFKGAYSEDNNTDSVTEVNIVRSMTKAEFDLLSADEKVGIINITDDVSGGLKYVKEILWENIDESDMNILANGDIITLTDNILDYDEVYFEGCYIEPYNSTGKKITHLAVTKVMRETINLAKSKYGSGQYEGMFDVAHNFAYSGGYYSSAYSLKIPTDNSFYVAFKYVGGWTANACTLTRITGVKYLSDSEHTYSTDEQIVGTWIDGSTLYEKTIDLGTLPIRTIKGVSANIAANLDKVVCIDGVAIKSNNNTFIKLPYNATDGGTADLWYDRVGQYGLSNDCVVINTNADFSSFSGYATLRYTKSSS